MRKQSLLAAAILILAGCGGAGGGGMQSARGSQVGTLTVTIHWPKRSGAGRKNLRSAPEIPEETGQIDVIYVDNADATKKGEAHVAYPTTQLNFANVPAAELTITATGYATDADRQSGVRPLATGSVVVSVAAGSNSTQADVIMSSTVKGFQVTGPSNVPVQLPDNNPTSATVFPSLPADQVQVYAASPNNGTTNGFVPVAPDQITLSPVAGAPFALIGPNSESPQTLLNNATTQTTTTFGIVPHLNGGALGTLQMKDLEDYVQDLPAKTHGLAKASFSDTMVTLTTKTPSTLTGYTSVIATTVDQATGTYYSLVSGPTLISGNAYSSEGSPVSVPGAKFLSGGYLATSNKVFQVGNPSTAIYTSSPTIRALTSLPNDTGFAALETSGGNLYLYVKSATGAKLANIGSYPALPPTYYIAAEADPFASGSSFIYVGNSESVVVSRYQPGVATADSTFNGTLAENCDGLAVVNDWIYALEAATGKVETLAFDGTSFATRTVSTSSFSPTAGQIGGAYLGSPPTQKRDVVVGGVTVPGGKPALILLQG